MYCFIVLYDAIVLLLNVEKNLTSFIKRVTAHDTYKAASNFLLRNGPWI